MGGERSLEVHSVKKLQYRKLTLRILINPSKLGLGHLGKLIIATKRNL